MSTLTVKELAAPTGFDLKIASGETLDLKSQGTVTMPAGSVLQVVQAEYSSETSSTSGTYADTGLTATITPTNSSSKILVCVNQNGLRHYGGNTDINLYLQKDSSNWKNMGGRLTNLDGGTPAANSIGSASGEYLDSPGNTSAHTYKTRFARRLSTGTVRCQDEGAVSTITLIEIAG